LFRWVASFLLPVAVVLVCMATAWVLNTYKKWPLPDPVDMVAMIGALGWLTALPARGYWLVAWGAIALAGLVGLPSLPAVGLLGVAASFVPPLARPRPVSTSARSLLRGWGALLIEVGRSTALLSAGALAATVILHVAIPQHLLPGWQGALIWLFVSAIAAMTYFPMRRWVEALCSLRLLPLGSHRLALTLYVILTLPGVVTCLVVMAVRALSPNWGLDIPPYMLLVFLLAPATLVRWYKPYGVRADRLLQQWTPALQQAAWPLWAGSLSTLRGLPYMPGWVLAYFGTLVLFFAVFGYRALLGSIRSTAPLDGGWLDAA
jgi:hypothetical protein